MITFEGLDENFKFLVLEVKNQILTAREFMGAPSRELFEKINSRDDYIDNLKTIIENKCYSRINAEKDLERRRLNYIRAMQVMSVNLERIADYFVNIARQMGYLQDQAFIQRYDWKTPLDIILAALDDILPAFRKENLAKGLAVCKTENELDRIYKENFDLIMKELGRGKQTQNLITALFIFRYFERVGDSLLNIGEAIIFSILGERIKIEQFDALRQTLDKSGFSKSLSEIDFEAIWGSRSGCRISRVEPGAPPDKAHRAQGGIFKEGNLKKIRREKENIDRWRDLFPGLVADVYGYHEDGEKASMLVEFLNGCTLDEVALSTEREYLNNALFILEQTVLDTWLATKQDQPMATNYIGQLRDRLDSVLQVHPEFTNLSMGIGQKRIMSTQELLAECVELEAGLQAPFSVFIHGDFNINNLVYNHETQQVHYIDLYRSRRFDYVQDVSVFLVSNFRMPVFETGLRERLNYVIGEFFRFTSRFAREQDDSTFQARLAFALARSFYTSTRFELNHKFAKVMFNRAVFLLEKIRGHGDRPWEDFTLPPGILNY